MGGGTTATNTADSAVLVANVVVDSDGAVDSQALLVVTKATEHRALGVVRVDTAGAAG